MKYKSLHDVCDFISGLWTGKKPPYIKVNVIRNTNFHKNGNLDFENVAELDVEIKQFNTRQLKFGDIILEKSGGGPNQPVGRVCLFEKKNEKFSLSNFTCALRVKNENELNYKYLYYFLRYLYMSGETEKIQTNSTGIRNLQIKLYKDYKLFIEPLPIQVKIVAKLDQIFAEIDKATATAEANVKNVEALFKSYLREAYKGDKNWKTVALGDICTIVNGGTPKSEVSEYWDGDLNWITPKEMGKLTTREITNTERKITEKGIKNSSAKLLPINSVILSSRAPIGHLAINKSLMATNQGCKGLVSSERLNYEYLYYFLSHSKQLLNDMGSGATFKELSGSKLSTVEIPLPNLTIQQDIISKINKISSEVSKLNNLYKNKLSDLLFFKQSILKQAFNGELVKAA